MIEPKLISTTSLFEIQVKEIFERLGNKSYDWLFITKQSIFPCEANIHSEKESLVNDIADALTCGHIIVDIYYRGRQLSRDEIGSSPNI